MKTKITFQNFATTVIALLLLTGFNVKAQTHFFQDAVANGTIWHAAASEISNPKSDAVNSSSVCIQNTGAGAWQDTQISSISYTIKAGDKIYVSFYNPNGAAAWQLKMNVNGSDTWIAQPSHATAAAAGWNEVSVDLTAHVGKALTQIKIFPAADESKSINFDNIYIHTASVLGASGPTHFFQDAVVNGTIWHAAASEISNPKSDAVNSSSVCIQNTGAGAWQDTQISSISYTIKAGDKIYVSFYNPNGAAAWQLKMNVNGSDTWIAQPSHATAAATGWNEVSVDLATYVGQALTQIKIFPTADESKAINFDNIYIGATSVISTPPSQTHFFQDAVANGTIWHAAASEISNPKSDAVNSSLVCIQNTGAGGWQDTQINSISYTIKSGDKIFVSFYNPNGAAAWQLKMNVNGADTWIGEPTHASGAASGWNEVSVELGSYVGQALTQIKVFPAAGQAKSVYFDNIYFASASVLSTNSNSLAKVNIQVYVSKEGKIQFGKEQTNSQLSVFDLTGRLIIEEKINGTQGVKTLNNKGIYIVRVKSDQGVSTQKIVY
jgi:co-chaperonin GroES (HSP10)